MNSAQYPIAHDAPSPWAATSTTASYYAQEAEPTYYYYGQEAQEMCQATGFDAALLYEPSYAGVEHLLES